VVVHQPASEALDRVFAALADATRRDIVTRVLQQEASVSVLARNYDMSFAAVQKHVAVLERARLVSKERRGREQIVRGDVGTVRAAARLLGDLEDLWRARIGRLEQVLDDPPGGDPSCPSSAPHPTPSS
jgi:DNA-binding transcriptional ArsR family regulator